MFGWLSRARAQGLAGEPLGEGRIGTDLGWEDFDGHHSVQFLLPGLVDCTHAPYTEEFEEFQLWKSPG